jgi:hypothetical protein
MEKISDCGERERMRARALPTKYLVFFASYSFSSSFPSFPSSPEFSLHISIALFTNFLNYYALKCILLFLLLIKGN